ncbi:hypothetical protein QE152_g26464 [Popillia japonica]|uniref:Uncharacterized protein n=1 Tax=Popillia japonica TaxID=7064 RepID=A0AAW1JWZ3_POPJA
MLSPSQSDEARGFSKVHGLVLVLWYGTKASFMLSPSQSDEDNNPGSVFNSVAYEDADAIREGGGFTIRGRKCSGT